jgi:hypothetical protein
MHEEEDYDDTRTHTPEENLHIFAHSNKTIKARLTLCESEKIGQQCLGQCLVV